MESCFGEELMADIKAEVEAACDKCDGQQGPEMPHLRHQMADMFPESGYAPRPAHFRHSVQYVPVPVQFQPVGAATLGS